MSKKNEKGKKKPTPVLKNPLIITVAITLAVLLVLGSVTGIVVAVRSARAVISYGGVRIEAGAAAYLATTSKTGFINKHEGVDHPSFWESEYEEGVTYGELLEEQTVQYLREVAAGAYLFDRYASLTADERRMIKQTADDIITNYYGSLDKAAFNKRAKEMGFDYNSFVDALTLQYKQEQAMRRIYGDGGSVLAQGGYASECDKYYSTFAYAKLLFIRTDYEYKTDENGEYLRDQNGNFLTRPLTDEEKTEREADVADIRDAISALRNGTDGQMNEGFFNSMLAKYDYDDYTRVGYFFSTVVDSKGVPLATATRLFAEELGADILNCAFSLEVGEYGELSTEYGLCFVYRGALAPSSYASDTYKYFFSDFYEDAATYLYYDSLAEISSSVTVKDKYFEKVDIVALPYNSEFVKKGYVGS